MKTLFVAWKDRENARGWFPVGRLDADIKENSFRFRYVHGAEDASQQCGFVPFDSFPQLYQEYFSAELFPFFANRLQNANQPNFLEILRRLDIDSQSKEDYDPMEVLAVSEGRRATDNLEIFPKVQPAENGSFHIKFFLHGWRYIHPDSAAKILQLNQGDPLGVAIEVTNPATQWAIQIQTPERVVIGYAPRYLVRDLVQVILGCSVPVEATVNRLNLPPAPLTQRLLISLKGCWPEEYEPMSGDEFRVLVGQDELAEWP